MMREREILKKEERVKKIAENQNNIIK